MLPLIRASIKCCVSGSSCQAFFVVVVVIIVFVVCGTASLSLHLLLLYIIYSSCFCLLCTLSSEICTWPQVSVTDEKRLKKKVAKSISSDLIEDLAITG